jgi:integrase
VHRLKGSKKPVQPLLSRVDPLLNEETGLVDYLSKLSGNQKLFPIGRRQFWKLFRAYAERAEIPAHKRHPHVLKHTIGTELCDSSGVPITQAWLGHKSGNSTLQYTKKTEQQAAEAVHNPLAD